MRARFAIPVLMGSIAMFTGSATADPVADFYKGRVLTITIGTGTGGGYSLYARLAVDHMGRHIPGNPTLVMQSMPGAGGKNMLNYAAKAAPRDGSWIFVVLQTLATDQVMRVPGVAYDARRFAYIGRFTDNTPVSVGWTAASVDSIDVARQRVVVTGGTGAASPTDIMPKLLNRYAGTRFRLITGYKGLPEIAFAMENGEVQAMVGSWVGFKTDFVGLLRTKRIKVLTQLAGRRHPELADIPTVSELAQTASGKAIADFAASSGEIGRALAAPPGIPDDRLAALRTAFAATLKDTAFIADATKRSADLNPETGGYLEGIVETTLKTHESTVQEAAETMAGDGATK